MTGAGGNATNYGSGYAKGGDGVEEDLRFHRSIAEAAHNPFQISTLGLGSPRASRHSSSIAVRSDCSASSGRTRSAGGGPAGNAPEPPHLRAVQDAVIDARQVVRYGDISRDEIARALEKEGFIVE